MLLMAITRNDYGRLIAHVLTGNNEYYSWN